MGAARTGGAVETATTAATVGASSAATTMTAAAVLGEGRCGHTNQS
jgi:hypothetical protein